MLSISRNGRKLSNENEIVKHKSYGKEDDKTFRERLEWEQKVRERFSVYFPENEEN